MDPSAWVFPYSPNMGVGTASPAPGGWQFTIPTQDGIHMAVAGVQGRLQGSKLTTAFQKTGEILEVQPCGTNSAKVRLFLQQRGDDWSGSGKYEFYRWYSGPADLNDSGLTVPLQPGSWSSVLGKNGDQNPAGFNTAISDLQSIGFAFGGCFAAHGVYATGPATFTATSYRIDP